MLLSLQGRVENVQLRRTHALLPLFEAVINSIQAIASSPRRAKGNIEITALRDERQGTLEERDKDQDPITGFEILDNGCGFDAPNFQAFQTSDTRRKVALGGKGIGRLLWLKAFDSVEIDSYYETDGSVRRRRFRFVLGEKGVEDERTEPASGPPRVQTRVSLIGLKSEYQSQFPKRLRTIGERLVEHCLSHFLQANCPTITIRDSHDELSVNALYDDLFKTAIERVVTVRTQLFRVLQLRLYGSEHEHHTLHFCANEREVETTRLSKLIPDLVGHLHDDMDRPFCWAVYVFGDYLDHHVHPERGGFMIPSEDSEDGELLENEPSLAAIRDGILPLVLEGLKPFLAPLERRKQERVQKFVEERAPEYRAVLKHTDIIRRLSPDLSEGELDRQLHAGKRDLELEVRKQGAKFLAQSEIEELPEDYVRKVMDLSQANLVKYVVDRWHVLEILARSLARKPDGRYQLEKSIHQLIFPMRATSDDVLEHNLWVIDDRLAYHAYLASDVPLSQQEILANEGDASLGAGKPLGRLVRATGMTFRQRGVGT
jgi:hypothetical protein